MFFQRPEHPHSPLICPQVSLETGLLPGSIYIPFEEQYFSDEQFASNIVLAGYVRAQACSNMPVLLNLFEACEMCLRGREMPGRYTMSYSPFIIPYEQLPKTLPIFPLPGAIVMPGNQLPLNIFEPRYLNMVNDVLSTHRMIGMIQPNQKAGDETELHRTGCAGRITEYRETDDGRIEMVLSGVCRYDVDEVLPTTRGYSLCVPNWSRFRGDYATEEVKLHGEHERLVQTLKRYFEANGLDTDWSALQRLPTVKLMNTLSMALPFSEQDKQVLLETIEPAERLFTFTALLDSEHHESGSNPLH
jgi:Lon protease-like protein